MKKKIICILMVMSFSIMMIGCLTSSEVEKSNHSSNQVEEITSTTAPTSTEVPTPTEALTSTPTLTPTEVPTPTPEPENTFASDFEGKYWVEEYYEYHGYYFDGTNAIMKGDGWEKEYSYYLESDKDLDEYTNFDGWINIDGESYLYRLRDGVFALTMPAMEIMTYREVDKAEFDRLFDSATEETNSTTSFDDEVDGK